MAGKSNHVIFPDPAGVKSEYFTFRVCIFRRVRGIFTFFQTLLKEYLNSSAYTPKDTSKKLKYQLLLCKRYIQRSKYSIFYPKKFLERSQYSSGNCLLSSLYCSFYIISYIYKIQKYIVETGCLEICCGTQVLNLKSQNPISKLRSQSQSWRVGDLDPKSQNHLN